MGVLDMYSGETNIGDIVKTTAKIRKPSSEDIYLKLSVYWELGHIGF